MARVEKGEPLDTLQAVYDLWVDGCEEAYAEHVFSDEYAKVHGRVVNSLIALKRHSRAMVDETLGMLNMPTRKEMNTLQARFQDLRRDLRAMQASQGVTEDAGTPVEPTAPTRRAAAKKTAAPGRTASKQTGGPTKAASKQASPGAKAPEAAPTVAPRRKTAAGHTTCTGRAKS